VAMVVMVPLLTWYSDIVALAGAGIYVAGDLGWSMAAYVNEIRSVLVVDDVMHGIGKSILFAVLITVVGVVNGIAVTGGAEGVGRMTTRSVVHAISAIVVTDMVFAFIVTR
jgi:phospholipid/cholesterol/gamma-HCH transport system permease protein